MDRKFVVSAFTYGVLGMLLGIYMAASHNHGQLVTHAHIMLAGFVLSFIYALCHRLWLVSPVSFLAKLQFWIHQLSILILVVGLFLVYGRFVSLEKLDPVLALASISLMLALVLMFALFLRSAKQEANS